MNEEETEVTGKNGKHAACEAFSSLKVKKPQLPHVPHTHTQPLYHALTPAPHLNPHHQLFHSPRETADTVEKFIDDNTRQNCILVQCVPH